MIRTCLLLVAFATGSTMAAQPVIGIKAGGHYTLTNTSAGDQAIAGAPVPKALDGLGYHGGIFAEVGLTEDLFLRAEVLYSVRRYRYDESFDTTFFFEGFPITARAEVEVKVERSYLEIPLLAGYRFGDRFSVVAGPAAAILLGSNAAINGEVSVGSFFQGFSLPFSSTDDGTEGLRGVGWAAVAGMQYRGVGGFDVGLRYWHGLGALEEDTDFLRTRQSMLQLAVGFAFLRPG
jgi:hypothetical protein